MLFVDIVPGRAEDQVVQLTDPVFNVQGIKTRRVEPRNAPTVINAIFNHRNFWDGRAQTEFNGVNPFGSRDDNARVLKVDVSTGVASPVQTGITDGASLASLSCGPVLSANEMSADGRTLPKLGKKMLALQPLAKQIVAPDDSVLGPLSNARSAGVTSVPSRGAGLGTTYIAMIHAAFRPEWWQSMAIVTFDATGSPTVRMPPAGARVIGKHRGHGAGTSENPSSGAPPGGSSSTGTHSGGSPDGGGQAGGS